MFPTIKQSTALTMPFFLHDANGDAVTGKVDGDFTKSIRKEGGSFGAMTVTIAELAGGWYTLAMTTAHTDTVGMLAVYLTVTGAKQVNLLFRVGARIIDDLAYPATSGRSLAVDTNGRVDLGAWVGGAPDALSSGKVPADLKLWLTTAPASLTTNGYVQAMLLRWLTDDAGGIPSALSSGNVQALAAAIATGAINAAALAVGAIEADTFAAGAINAAAIADGAIDAATFAAGAINAAAIADGAIDAATLAADFLTAVADAILKRDFSSVSGESARSLLNAARALRNKVAIVTGTMTVYKEDDATAAWTAAATGTTGADPITAIDPA